MRSFLITTCPEYASDGQQLQLIQTSEDIVIAGHKMDIVPYGGADYLFIKNQANELVFSIPANSVKYCRLIEQSKGVLISAVNSNKGGEQ